MPDRKDLHTDALESNAADAARSDAHPDDVHPDAIERLRVALWCPEEPLPVRHASECEPCTAELVEIRRIRDIMVAARSSEPSPEAVRAVEHALTEAADAPTSDALAMDFTWLRAEPVGAMAGVRGIVACDGLMRCSTDDMQLDVLLGAGLSGQVLGTGDEPCPGLEVTLFLDRRPAGAVRTDRFGEFSLELSGRQRAQSIGVRVVGYGRPRHVEVWRAESNS